MFIMLHSPLGFAVCLSNVEKTKRKICKICSK